MLRNFLQQPASRKERARPEVLKNLDQSATKAWIILSVVRFIIFKFCHFLHITYTVLEELSQKWKEREGNAKHESRSNMRYTHVSSTVNNGRGENPKLSVAFRNAQMSQVCKTEGKQDEQT